MHITNSHGQPIGAPLETTLPRPAPARSALAGRYCTLRPTRPQDAPGLFGAFVAASDATDWTYLPYGPFDTETAFAQWLDATCLGDDPLFHTVFDGDGNPVGLASFLRIDPASGVIEVGHIHFSRQLQRSPASTEAMYLLMARVFDELGYRRYEWKCDALNAPSRRAAERLGFTYEGTFRQATHYKGRNRDTAWFAILNRDWPEQKARFETWLDPGNFAPDGRQKTALRR